MKTKAGKDIGEKTESVNLAENSVSSAVTRTGTVVSAKMTKTVIVMIEKYQKHPLYKKQIKKSAKFKAHDDLGAKVGQKVKITQTRPVSKGVHFKVVEVINA